MQAKSCHSIPPPIFPASPAKSLPANKVSFPAKISRAISITAPGDVISTQNVDDTVAAFWDYQFLFVSQRSETADPITLRVVDGAVPPDFPCGTYYLTGPGVFTDDHGSTVHPLDGHGYLRAFTIDGVKGVVKFMAKYIKTEAQTEERDPLTGRWRFTHRGPFSVLKGGKMVGNTKVMKNVANTSVLGWGERLFCLWEGGDPYEIDSRSLDTIGKFDVIDDDGDGGGGGDGSGESEMVGELKGGFWDVAATLLKPILYEFDSNFKMVQKKEFNIPDHLMIHDWAFTDSHYILFGNRIKLDITGSMAAVFGLSPMISALAVNPSKPTSPIYLLPRSPPNSNELNYGNERDWRVPIEAPSQMWVLHVGNAFENRDDDNTNSQIHIQASVCSYRWFNFQKMFGYDWQSGKLDPSMMNRKEENLLPHLVQVSINLDANGECQECSVKSLNEWKKASDFPVINQDYSGAKNTYIYAATTSGSRQALPHFPFDTVLKLNTLNKSIHTWSVGSRRFIGEPIFVPKGTQEEEDNGYILVVEYAVSTQRCYLVVLSSKKIGETGALVARLEVPRSLNFPLGFHGFWAPSSTSVFHI
ncbi:carotenoid cleavage dioxygenase 7, chloroplastic isoform X2 [Camellia sinensis]|uniref:carotenoid cleavage dioxygenase 7, chloroplastic isoform X2 n=1 Tax=Camellia sinensis TaxID=4442 RepID=UPI00103613D3|nr:carotenoid cleavage dioxygenase 7, chloroplastic isoform X2 [Camellia sinensis]